MGIACLKEQGYNAFEEVEVKVAQSCPSLCDFRDCTVHGVLQPRILQWVVFPFSRGSSQPRGQTQVSHTAGKFFTGWATGEAFLLNAIALSKKKKKNVAWGLWHLFYLATYHAKSLQSCLTLCNPMDFSLPGCSVRGIPQARILERVAVPSPGCLPGPGIAPVGTLPLAPPGKPCSLSLSLFSCEVVSDSWDCGL